MITNLTIVVLVNTALIVWTMFELHDIKTQLNLTKEEIKMANLRESAKAYVPPQTLNVADLEAISLDVQIEQRKGKDNKGKEFEYSVALVTGKEYRVPASVLNDIKTIMETKPTLKTVKVVKKGQGMNTEYTVIPLE
jgi:predicted Holliday junction resolvase-like endonuclease